MNTLVAGSTTREMMTIVAALLSAAAFTGCTQAVDDEMVAGDEMVGEVSEAIGEAACADLTPAATYTGFISVPHYESPQTYGTAACVKAIAVRINNYNGSYVGAPWSDYGGTHVGMVSTGASTQSACEATLVRADLYDLNPATQKFSLVRSREAHGVWMNFFENWFCYPPGMMLRNANEDAAILIAGHTYKIVATARTTTTGATQKLRILSQQDGIIH